MHYFVHTANTPERVMMYSENEYVCFITSKRQYYPLLF